MPRVRQYRARSPQGSMIKVLAYKMVYFNDYYPHKKDFLSEHWFGQQQQNPSHSYFRKHESGLVRYMPCIVWS